MTILNKNQKKAFSLLELSIVVLIIGLIIAAVNAGSKLIKKAERGMASYEEAVGLRITNPKKIDGLAMWLDSDQISGSVNGGAVATWKDMSGNGKDATQINSANQPIYKTNLINGLSALDFNGSSNFLNYDGSIFINTNFTVFAVTQRPNSSRAQNPILGFITGTCSSGLLLGHWSNGTEMYIGQGCDDDVFSNAIPSFSAPTTEIHSTTSSGANGKKYYYNGSLKALSSHAGSPNNYITSSNNNMIGKYNTYYFQGHIGEILIYTKTLSDSDRKAIESYLGTKWGVTVAN